MTKSRLKFLKIPFFFQKQFSRFKQIAYKSCTHIEKMLCNSSNNIPDILKLAEVKKPKMR